MLIGLVGKPNTGKSTFFSAATLVSVPIAPYPFTTIEPNKGIAHARVKCVCREMGVTDSPKNSVCVEGTRFAPVELIDVAGLVPDAWKGRGLGNKFLDELRRADVLLHIVDSSGGTDSEGKLVNPGTHDPAEDVTFLTREIGMWIHQILSKDWERAAKAAEVSGTDAIELLEKRLTGLSITRKQIVEAVRKLQLNTTRPLTWRPENLFKLSEIVRQISKPIIIVANKIDSPYGETNFVRLKDLFKESLVVPCSAESELALKRAAKKGAITYQPGDPDFKINSDRLSSQQKEALDYIRDRVLNKFGSTGVQNAIERAIFDALAFIAVFPIEDVPKLTDHDGRVLPDVFLAPPGTTAREFAYLIHSELGETFIYAVDARTKQKIGEEHQLENRDIVKIVAGKGLK
jgi:ribosome-binding ATPase YchF (GTP1/OBG family)